MRCLSVLYWPTWLTMADEAYVAYVDLRGLTWLTWTYETNEAYEAYVDLCVALGGLVRSCHSGAV